MPKCETCTRQFFSAYSCNQHMDETQHWAHVYECEACDREFRSSHAVEQHMTALGHRAPTFPCETCSLEYPTLLDSNFHMMNAGHFRYFCAECKMRFENENALQMHLRSRIHRGATVLCPFCKRSFTTASGLSAHLETNACENAPILNRETVLVIMRNRDPYGLITNKQIEWYDRAGSSYEVTPSAWNGNTWDCSMCNRQFNNVNGLRNHLNSPRHKGKIYHCPNKRGGCEREFVSLAALFNHLESESCSYMRFENVQQHVQQFFTSNRMISI